MQLYIYARSGHNFGLENIRRASAISNMLQESDPILCSADYRAATFAKEYLNVNKGVGVDVIGNMPNVMERGDMLIFDDSGEASETMQTHMKEFCTKLYEIGKDIPYDIVDEIYFDKVDIKRDKVLFFADDDYNEWFLKLMETGSKKDFPLIWGHYFFFKNESKMAEYFSEVFEEEDYQELVKSTKYLLTASVQTALESLASGNSPVFFKRGDKEPANIELIEKYNIPIVSGKDFDTLVENFEQTIQNYPQTNTIEKFNITKIKEEVEGVLKKFEAIKPSLEYKF
jgi:hypothetical protein